MVVVVVALRSRLFLLNSWLYLGGDGGGLVVWVGHRDPSSAASAGTNGTCLDLGGIHRFVDLGPRPRLDTVKVGRDGDRPPLFARSRWHLNPIISRGLGTPRRVVLRGEIYLAIAPSRFCITGDTGPTTTTRIKVALNLRFIGQGASIVRLEGAFFKPLAEPVDARDVANFEATAEACTPAGMSTARFRLLPTVPVVGMRCWLRSSRERQRMVRDPGSDWILFPSSEWCTLSRCPFRRCRRNSRRHRRTRHCPKPGLTPRGKGACASMWCLRRGSHALRHLISRAAPRSPRAVDRGVKSCFGDFHVRGRWGHPCGLSGGRTRYIDDSGCAACYASAGRYRARRRRARYRSCYGSCGLIPPHGYWSE
ncbi:MAG: hypothetical protein JWM76_4631 [Pseudonocardiales bacterium]|nr:hypothetical protein [Pseudonocardiales bacterium]